MAEKPPEEGYISVVDEEPELLELLRWGEPQNQKVTEETCPNACSPEPQQAQEKSTTVKEPEPKVSKASEIDLFDLPEAEFIENYRLSKELTRNLFEELNPVFPEAINKNSNDVAYTRKILSSLSFFATGKFQKQLSKASRMDLSLPQYTAQQATIHVIQAINHPSIVKKYIHFPHLAQERDDVKARFYLKYGMPNVLGCVECTHVPISKPDDEFKIHFNKSYHSKKVQIICDSSLQIMSVHPAGGALGHDGILSRHAVSSEITSLRASGEHCYLLGGTNYTLKPYVMTPVPKITKKSPEGPEKFYNTVLSQTHSCVTDTIKHLKSRWKCLQTSHKHLDQATAGMMVVACCVLHNICNRVGLPTCTMTPAEERLEIMKQKVAHGSWAKRPEDDEEGLQIRKQLVERVWSERRVEPEMTGPKKRMTKKDRLLQGYQNQNNQNSTQSQVQVMSQSHQGHQSHHSQAPSHPAPLSHEHDPKRPRLMAPPYIMTTAWGHYPPHHQ